MKIIDKKIDDCIKLAVDFPIDHIFIDIETTGLKKESTNLYLVGVTHKVQDGWAFRQWFIESPMEEAVALESIADYLRDFTTLVHYNGEGFDLPYLDYHAKVAGVPSPYLEMKSYDLYKKIKCCRSLFLLDSARQKSFERFIGNEREDEYSGGELIQKYFEYASIVRSTNAGAIADDADDKTANELLNLLLLHNEEDVLGMRNLLNLISYADLHTPSQSRISAPEIISQTDSELLIKFISEDDFLYKVKRPYENFYLSISGHEINLKIPVCVGTMKYFFPRALEYYYLPKEDIAIHKSVGASVDPNFREQATKDNCYTKKEGAFIPLLQPKIAPAYHERYGSLPYTLICDELMSDVSFWKKYLSALLREIQKDCYLM